MLERYIRDLKKENSYLKDGLSFFDLFYLKQISLLLNCKVTEILKLDKKRIELSKNYLTPNIMILPKQ
ncbi:hypothetical protein [Thomasclavelia spiroformis]|uniref:hypothetical protein n=1 Tax=Thomasclavelia spiroformis TaxID=29348 RepID=UPI00242DDBC3|nr:hypothetical protein [Thomasclavelia spiroformis]